MRPPPREEGRIKILGSGHSTLACRTDPASFLDHFKHWLLQESEPVGAQTGKSVNDITNVQWHIAVDVEQSQPSESIG